MKKLLVVLLIILCSAALFAGDDGRRESGLGISYANFALGTESYKNEYEGYGLEFYSNNRFGTLLNLMILSLLLG